MHIFSIYVYTGYLHAYLIPLDILCSQTMYQPKLFLCASTMLTVKRRCSEGVL